MESLSRTSSGTSCCRTCAAAPRLSWMDAAWVVVVGSYAFPGRGARSDSNDGLSIHEKKPPAWHRPGDAAARHRCTGHDPHVARVGTLLRVSQHGCIQQPHACPPQTAGDSLWFDREGVCRWREPARRPHAERGVVLSALAKSDLMICLVPATVMLAAWYRAEDDMCASCISVARSLFRPLRF